MMLITSNSDVVGAGLAALSNLQQALATSAIVRRLPALDAFAERVREIQRAVAQRPDDADVEALAEPFVALWRDLKAAGLEYQADIVLDTYAMLFAEVDEGDR